MVLITTYTASRNSSDTPINNNICVLHLSGDIEDNFQEIYEENRHKLPNISINTYQPLIQPSDINIQDWNKLAQDIQQNYKHCDAFVVFHDKENLHYTSSALSFILENLNKPVIFTNKNLIHTLLVAKNTNIPEVMILSGNKLLRACRTTYNDNNQLFSPNCPSLTKDNSLSVTPTNQEPVNTKFFNTKNQILIIKLYPNINIDHLAKLASKKELEVSAIILESCQGSGCPVNEKFLKILMYLIKSGVIIVNISQHKTPPDVRLLSSGVIYGGDMTSATAFAKLHFLLGNISDYKLIPELIQKNFRGEISEYF